MLASSITSLFLSLACSSLVASAPAVTATTVSPPITADLIAPNQQVDAVILNCKKPSRLGGEEHGEVWLMAPGTAPNRENALAVMKTTNHQSPISLPSPGKSLSLPEMVAFKVGARVRMIPPGDVVIHGLTGGQVFQFNIGGNSGFFRVGSSTVLDGQSFSITSNIPGQEFSGSAKCNQIGTAPLSLSLGL